LHNTRGKNQPLKIGLRAWRSSCEQIFLSLRAVRGCFEQLPVDSTNPRIPKNFFLTTLQPGVAKKNTFLLLRPVGVVKRAKFFRGTPDWRGSGEALKKAFFQLRPSDVVEKTIFSRYAQWA
jgi:hypothetical protein